MSSTRTHTPAPAEPGDEGSEDNYDEVISDSNDDLERDEGSGAGPDIAEHAISRLQIAVSTFYIDSYLVSKELKVLLVGTATWL